MTYPPPVAEPTAALRRADRAEIPRMPAMASIRPPGSPRRSALPSAKGSVITMSETRFSQPHRNADILLRAAVVALTLATGYIHLTLGGLLFTLNAIGYALGAAAMVVPLAIAVRYRWLLRIGLAGYAAATIVAWAIDPLFYPTAYLAKAIEVALIALLAVDFARRDGNPVMRVREELRALLARPHGPASGRT